MGDFLDDCDDNVDLFQKNGLPSWITSCLPSPPGVCPPNPGPLPQ